MMAMVCLPSEPLKNVWKLVAEMASERLGAGESTATVSVPSKPPLFHPVDHLASRVGVFNEIQRATTVELESMVSTASQRFKSSSDNATSLGGREMTIAAASSITLSSNSTFTSVQPNTTARRLKSASSEGGAAG